MSGPTSFGYQNLGFGAGGEEPAQTLKLLLTQTADDNQLDFTLGTAKIYFITFNDIHFASQSEFGYKLSDDGGSSYETGYAFGNERVIDDGTAADRKATGQDSARLFGDIDSGANSLGNGYLYLYNPAESSQPTYSTSHSVTRDNADKHTIEYGTQMYNTASTINKIRFGLGTTTAAFTSGTISLYELQVG